MAAYMPMERLTYMEAKVTGTYTTCALSPLLRGGLLGNETKQSSGLRTLLLNRDLHTREVHGVEMQDQSRLVPSSLEPPSQRIATHVHWDSRGAQEDPSLQLFMCGIKSRAFPLRSRASCVL